MSMKFKHVKVGCVVLMRGLQSVTYILLGTPDVLKPKKCKWILIIWMGKLNVFKRFYLVLYIHRITHLCEMWDYSLFNY